MTAMSKLSRTLRRLPADRGGAVSPLAAFAVIALVGFVGIATDTARGYFVKSRLSQALDAAALAGGRVFFEDTRDADIQKYFSANFPDGFMDATLTPLSILPSKDAGGDRLDLSASATLPTTFMRVVGINNITVSASNQVTRQTAYLDVVLSIDLSTSMNESAGGTTKIAAARQAATTLVNILFGDNETKDLLKVGVVPWTAKVNVTYNGQTFNSSATYSDPVAQFTNPLTGGPQTWVWRTNNSPVAFLSKPANNWKGCVYARYIWEDEDGDPPESDPSHADTVIDNHPGSWGTWMGYEPVSTSKSEPTSSSSSNCSEAPDGNSWTTKECTPCYTRGITALTNTKQTLLTAINQLTVNSTGTSYTNIAQGLLWAWNVITPEPPFDEADADPQGKRIQAIVLLTDGYNTGYYGDAYRAQYGSSFGIDSAARPELNARLQTIATNVKTQGIRIYAIQFGSQPDQEQIDLMKAVASDPDSSYYFYAPDAAALEAVFTEVANGLSELRLSK